MKKLLIILQIVALVIIFTSCSLINQGTNSKMFVRLLDSNFGQEIFSRNLIEAATPTVQGMYFGDLEIAAYQYSPGFRDKGGFGANGCGDGSLSCKDWAYYVVLHGGYDTSRDNLLKSYESIDIYKLDSYHRNGLSGDFTRYYTEFSVDFFEIYVYRTGLVMDNVYWGQNAENNGLDKHPLYKYPELATIEDHFVGTNIEGFPRQDQSFSIFFVRNDWFPEPVLVQLSEDWENHIYAYEWSDKALSEQQKALLESLATNGTGRRSYDHLVIVPYQGPLKIKMTDSGEGTEELQIDVKFDLNFSTLLSENCINEYLNTGNFTVIEYKLNNNIPFGLNLTVR